MTPAQAKGTYIDNYCQEKGYQVVKSEVANGIKLEISNLSDKIPLILYSSGSIVPQGNPNSPLRKEFEQLKLDLEQKPDLLRGIGATTVKSCNQKYEIIAPELQNKIKDELKSFGYSIEMHSSANNNEVYNAKIQYNSMNLSIIQYKTGALLIQGKQNTLFDEFCTLIEKLAKPAGKEVVVRFIADNSDALDSFNATFNPKLQNIAEENVKDQIGTDTFNFLEEHDQKYLVASQCLRLCKIPLPEFSPIVMPASKAFEGFAKKILIKIGFYPPNHFDSKSSSFSYINDKQHSSRQILISKESYAGTYLDKISLCLDENRNFMMHSNNSTVTKVNTVAEAECKLNDLFKELKEIFHYFKSNPVFGI